MRLKVFTARNMTEAMADIRRELGEDAVIVATETTDRGSVTVTAAVEPESLNPTSETSNIPPPNPATRSEPGPAVDPDALHQVIDFHRPPDKLSQSLLRTAMAMDVEDGVMALANALDSLFTFSPLADAPFRPIMVVGPPGGGKTVSLAKLTARAVIAGYDCLVVSTDTGRAGGTAQLKAFADTLQQPFETADSPEALQTLIREKGQDRPVFIDSLSINPFRSDEREMLYNLITAGEIEPILTLPTGLDPQEAAEAAAAMDGMGIRRLIGTRLDSARRLGGLLGAADAGGLGFCDCTTSPFIGEGVDPLNPVSLARLLVHCSGTKTITADPKRAAR